MYLSGLSSLDEYRDSALSEGKHHETGDKDDPKNVLTDSDADDDADDDVDEGRIRALIRREVRAVVGEVLAQNDIKAVEKARQTHSLSDALGFKTNQPRHNPRQGAGHTIGFSGPGFY